MHQYNVGASFEKVAVDIAGPFAETARGNRYRLVAMNYFTKWPEVYAIPNQEASTVADVLVSYFSCRFCVPMEVYSHQDGTSNPDYYGRSWSVWGFVRLGPQPYNHTRTEWWSGT
jgi:hypothetical protein